LSRTSSAPSRVPAMPDVLALGITRTRSSTLNSELCDADLQEVRHQSLRVLAAVLLTDEIEGVVQG